MRGLITGLTASALILLGACASSQIQQAFDGDLPEEENDKVITEYCVGCHTHREFDSDSHLFDVKYRYDSSSRFFGAERCNACHTYERDWLLDEQRGTHRPALR